MSNRSVFVGDLSSFVNETHLMHLFSQCGPIASIEIKRSASGDSLMHGFIKFMQEDAAKLAIRYFNDKKFMGRRMIINSTNSRAPKKPYDSWHKLTLHFTSYRGDGQDVTEEILDNLCSPFGEIGDTVVRNHAPIDVNTAMMNRKNMLPITGKEIVGYAVVFFVEAQAAQRAFEALNHQMIEGISFQCSISAHTAVSVLSAQLASNSQQSSQKSSPTAYQQQLTKQASSSPRSFMDVSQSTNSSYPQYGMENTSMPPQPMMMYGGKSPRQNFAATYSQQENVQYSPPSPYSQVHYSTVIPGSPYHPAMLPASHPMQPPVHAIPSEPLHQSFHPLLLSSMSASSSSSLSLPRPFEQENSPSLQGSRMPTPTLSIPQPHQYTRSVSGSFFIPSHTAYIPSSSSPALVHYPPPAPTLSAPPSFTYGHKSVSNSFEGQSYGSSADQRSYYQTSHDGK